MMHIPIPEKLTKPLAKQLYEEKERFEENLKN